jgi:hypothetical protein
MSHPLRLLIAGTPTWIVCLSQESITMRAQRNLRDI